MKGDALDETGATESQASSETRQASSIAPPALTSSFTDDALTFRNENQANAPAHARGTGGLGPLINAFSDLVAVLRSGGIDTVDPIMLQALIARLGELLDEDPSTIA